MSKSGQQPSKADVGGQRAKDEKSPDKSSAQTPKTPPASPTRTGSKQS